MALVRFGLRAADDPRVLNTVRIIGCLAENGFTRGALLAPLYNDGLKAFALSGLRGRGRPAGIGANVQKESTPTPTRKFVRWLSCHASYRESVHSMWILKPFLTGHGSLTITKADLKYDVYDFDHRFRLTQAHRLSARARRTGRSRVDRFQRWPSRSRRAALPHRSVACAEG
jgi:hypothetical protein